MSAFLGTCERVPSGEFVEAFQRALSVYEAGFSGRLQNPREAVTQLREAVVNPAEIDTKLRTRSFGTMWRSKNGF